MQIQKINTQQSFGTAYVNFNQKQLYKLSEAAQEKVIKLITKGVTISRISDDIYLSSLMPNGKLVQTSLVTNNTALRFTSENPKKEQQLVRIFKKLFGDNIFHTNIIENTPQNAARIEKANQAQQDWVIANL